jgi:SAM-dependent methyltransferase
VSKQPSGPDNAAAWDRLAEPYERHVGWPDDHLAWGLRCPPEEDLGLVSDVVGDARTVVLGCGGGQDLVALARLGAGPLTGVDPSSGQLEHARQRLSRAGLTARLETRPATDLAPLDDASADLVVSVQAFDYVHDLERAFAEIRRVLRPGGVFAMSVLHPADLSTEDAAPYGWHTPYHQQQRDWVWDGLTDREVALRSWFRSPAAWFTAVTAAGLTVQRLEEPVAVDARPWIERGWLDATTAAKLDVVPGTILLRARRD